MVLESLCEIVRKIVKEWIPKEKYSSEDEYRDDLEEFIRKELPRREQSSLFGILFETPKHHIRTNAGRYNVDIEIDKKIGIELKRDLKGETEITRLKGQISNYVEEYECVIVVLCGDMSEGTFDEIEDRIEVINSEYEEVLDLFPEPKVTVVRKD